MTRLTQHRDLYANEHFHVDFDARGPPGIEHGLQAVELLVTLASTVLVHRWRQITEVQIHLETRRDSQGRRNEDWQHQRNRHLVDEGVVGYVGKLCTSGPANGARDFPEDTANAHAQRSEDVEAGEERLKFGLV